MSPAFYQIARWVCLGIKAQCVRQHLIGQDLSVRRAPFILACTHLSHLEPIAVSCLMSRSIRWMARREFYQKRWARCVLRLGGSFSVDRRGYSLPAVRTAIDLAARGEIVGIFPEGEVSTGVNSVLRGAPIKRGVCTVAIRSGLPVVPVVVLGTHTLNRVAPWLPFKRARLWIAVGRDVIPPPRERGPRPRLEMSERLRSEFLRTYHDLLQSSGLTDAHVP